MNEPLRDEAGVVNRFLQVYLQDREAGRSLACGEYQKMFPGFESLIEREYAELAQPADPVSASPSRGDVERRMANDVESGRLHPLSFYVEAFPGFEMEVAAAYAKLLADDESLPAWSTAPEPGSDFDGYHIVREIGRGGYGVVFEARDSDVDRSVALKIIDHRQVVADPNAVVRLRREARAAGRLEHPGICPIYRVGEFRGMTYLVMQLIPGRPLDDVIGDEAARRGFLSLISSGFSDEESPAAAATPGASRGGFVAFFERLAEALHAAHRAGVIHRDVKPSNIMVTPTGEPVLLDFGIAREDDEGGTLTGSALVGTPAYTAPESLRGTILNADAQCDVYALGVTMFEAATGRRPFGGPSRDALYRAILEAPTPTPRSAGVDVPRDLAVVIETALERNRARRYRTASDLAEDLARVRMRRPILARPAGPIYRLRRWCQRNPWIAASIAAIVLILSVAVYQIDGARRRAEHSRRQSDQARNEVEGRYWASQALTSASVGNSAALEEAEKCAEFDIPRHIKNQALMEALRASHVTRVVGTRSAVLEVDAIDALVTAEGAMMAVSGLGGAVELWELDPPRLRWSHTPDRSCSSTAVRFTPDGQRVVAAWKDGAVSILDAKNGLLALRLEGHTGRVDALEISTDGRVLASVSGADGVKVHDLLDGRCSVTIDLPGCRGIRFSPDGKLLLAGAGHRVFSDSIDDIALFDAATGRFVRRFDHGALCRTFEFLDDRRFVVGDKEGRVCIWDIHSGSRLHAMTTASGGNVQLVLPDPRSDDIVVGYDPIPEDRVTGHSGLTLWSPLLGRVQPLRAHKHRVVRAGCFLPDGRLVSVGEDRQIVVWQRRESDWIPSEQQRMSTRGGATRLFCTQKSLVVQVKSGIALVAAQPIADASVVDPSKKAAVTRAVFSPNDLVLATGDADGQVRLVRWKPEALNLEHLAQFHLDSGIVSLEWSSDGNRIVVGTESGEVGLWQKEGGDLRRWHDHERAVRHLAFTPDGARCVSASDDGTARLYDFDESGASRKFFDGPEPVECLTMNDLGDRVALAFGRRAQVWKLPSAEPLWNEPFVSQNDIMGVKGLALDPSGERLAICLSREWGALVDIETKEILDSRLQASFSFLDFDGNRLIGSTRWSASTRVYDVRTRVKHILRIAERSEPRGMTSCLVVSPSRRYVARGGVDGQFTIWDLETDEVVIDFVAHEDAVLSTSFSHDEHYFTTSSRSGLARVWPLDPLPVVQRVLREMRVDRSQAKGSK